MSKTYDLTATLNTGRSTPDTSDDWRSYATWNEASSPSYLGNVGYDGWDYATNMLFNSSELEALRNKTINGIILELNVTKGTSGTFYIGYKLNNVASGNSNSRAWARGNNAGTMSAGADSIATVSNPSFASISVGKNNFTLNQLPQYGLTSGSTSINFGRWQFNSAILHVTTNESDYSYVLAFNANGGNGAPGNVQGNNVAVNPSYTFTIPSSVPTRTGYAFLGWSLSPNATSASYQPGGTITVSNSGTTTLYAVWKAQASVLSDATNANITEKTTVTWTNYGSFTNKLRFIFGSVDSGEISVSGTSYQYTLPSSWYAQIPTATSGTATVYLYTYSNGTLIGTSSRTFTAYVKSTVVPSINNPTATAVNAKWGLFLQKYSSAVISVSGGAGGSGATVQSYSITGFGVDYSVNTNDSSASTTTPIFTTAGTFAYTVKITDSRGRTTSKTVSVTVTAYTEPAISSLVGARCNSDGTLNPTTGTSIKATAVFTFSAVGSNTLTRTLSYKKHSSGSYTTAQTGINSGTSYVIAAGVAEISSSYDVRVVITDSLNNSASYVIVVPPVVGIAFGLKNDRARFGGPVEKAGLQVDWDAEFNGVVDVTQRRCYANLSQPGWYRAIKFSAINEYDLHGADGSIIDIYLSRIYNYTDNEAHKISLLRTYNNNKFVSENSVSNSLGIDGIRLTVHDGGSGDRYAYIDIHYSLTTENPVAVHFNVYSTKFAVGNDYTDKWFAESLQSVVPSPSGETVLTEYTFVANTGTPVSFSPTSGSVHNACWYARIGNVCYLHVDMKGLTPSTNTQIFTLPVGYRPLYPTAIQGQGQESYGALASCIVQTDGNVSIYSQDHYAVIDGNFICQV